MSIWCKKNKTSNKNVEKRAFYRDLLQKILYPEAGESPALEANGLKTCGMDFVSAIW